MGRFVPGGSIPRKILMLAACALVCAWVHPPVALAQRGGGRIAGGGRVIGRVSGPRAFAAAPFRGAGSPDFGIARGRVHFFRRPRFFDRPFLALEHNWDFNYFYWMDCGPYRGWGVGCNGLPADENGFENYVTRPAYEIRLYRYGSEPRELVELYMKDGSIYDATDYWFVNGQVHFTMVEEDGTKAVEQVMDQDELDFQTTIDVNTRRGFRMVMRDEPWTEFLREHPNITPPALTPPQKN